MNTVENPLISVIVPVYNVELYIDACLDSIKQQTFRNLEIIVVEDCSTDSSKQMLYSHLKDERIKLIQHAKNSGLSAARNTGIDAATGEYIMFVDSDDIVDVRLVEACVNVAKKTGAELVNYGFTPFEDGVSTTELPYPAPNLVFEPALEGDEYFERPHFAWQKFIRADVVHSAGLRFPVGLYYEDWPFHWHLGLFTKNRYQLPVAFYLYRQRDTSITGSKGEKLLDLFVIYLRVMALVQDYQADEIKSVLAKRIREGHWAVLTHIDSKFLVIALGKAKETEKAMWLNGYNRSWAPRATIISTVVRAPTRIALPALKVLRIALPALKVLHSTLRRKRS